MKQTLYFDNSATTLNKPECVYEAVLYAMKHFANPSRSFYKEALDAMRGVFEARCEIAKLVNLANPLQVAFTSSSTESLNLVIAGLISKEDHVITTVLEHNSVLRPLYLTNCDLDIVKCDKWGNFDYRDFEKLFKDNTKAIVCTHGSNVIGNIVDVKQLHALCQKHNCLLILDVSQTLGSVMTQSEMADILCFTGHKSLFGPQGTGGIIVREQLPFKITKTGGAGSHTFDHTQSLMMPDCFEVGTLNSHGIYGLKAGVGFINEIGIEAIHEKEMLLTNLFYEGIKSIPGIEIYGDFTTAYRLPVVALNLKGYDSAEVAQILSDEYQIATRGQNHCAPLLHEHFNTQTRGMVRFSFGYLNEIEQVKIAIEALKTIAQRKE